MARVKIFWTATAIKQRNQIFEYWNDRNKSNQYSRKLRIEINSRVDLLISHPKLGRETDFKNTRVLSMGYYSIFYKLTKERIIITAFWDSRQDPEKLLPLITWDKNRKTRLPDIIIAVTAIAYGFKLVTRNIANFRNIPALELIHPWD